MNDCAVDIEEIISFLGDKLLDAQQSQQLDEVESIYQIIELLKKRHQKEIDENS